MLGNEQGKEIYGYRKDYVVFDLETTGLDVEKDKIVEIGALRVRNGQITEEFSTFVDPECIIPQRVIDLHGITNDMTRTAPKIAEVLQMFDDFVGDDILVGQNIRDFDLPFIWRECVANFGKTISNDFIDNLSAARIALPELESHSLAVLAAMYNIERGTKHSAIYDSRSTQAVYEIVGKIAQEKLKDPDAIPLLKKKELQSLLKHSLLHTPDKIGITLDKDGWADVNDLIAGIARTREFNREMLEDIVNTDSGKKFTFDVTKSRIKAEKKS